MPIHIIWRYSFMGSYGRGWVMDLGANYTYVSGFDQDDVDDDDDDDDVDDG